MVFCNKTSYHLLDTDDFSHNPYFNRWFSAIDVKLADAEIITSVTILILIDGFLQFLLDVMKNLLKYSHNPYFNRWFSAIENCTNMITDFKLSQSLF